MIKTTLLSLSTLFAALYLLPAHAETTTKTTSKAPALKTEYTPKVIAGDTHVIHGPLGMPNPENQGFMNNPGIVVTDAGLVIIDAGSTVQVGEMVLATAKTISDQPVVATFSTHIHGDHWLGNQAIAAAYPDAKHYAHPKLTELANNGDAQTWVDLMLDLTEGASAGTIATIPADPMNDGDEIKIGNKTFRITHKGQAHTLTDAMVHVLEDDVYFLGDNTFNGRMGRMDDGNFLGLVETLDAAIAAKAQHYVPGHGLTGSVKLVENYQRLIAKVYEGAAKYYDEGLADYEMKPMIVETLKPYHGWSDFHDAIGRFTSLAVLEAEARAFE